MFDTLGTLIKLIVFYRTLDIIANNAQAAEKNTWKRRPAD